MIRFKPDSWWDVLMRPLDMISPEANIYVEVPAPDVRLAAALLLAVIALVFWKKLRGTRRPVFTLLALLLLATGPWLATSGNGRYFTPFLLLLGPLCVGLARLLPLSRSMKFASVGALLLIQAVLVAEVSPWGSWSLLYWRDAPYFQVAALPEEPRSYVTLTPISYSLIAPQFPGGSRWMNLSAPVSAPREREYARRWLADAKSLHLVAPSIPSQTLDDLQPSPAVIATFNRLIKDRGLTVEPDAACEFRHSDGLAGMSTKFAGADADAEVLSRIGFWFCPVRYEPVTATAPVQRDPQTERVFEAVEQLCPRFFRAGESATARVDGGATRHYVGSDTRVYVMDDGEVLYKFWRSLNPVTIGSRTDVLAGRVQLDCTRIRASTWRSGGP